MKKLIILLVIMIVAFISCSMDTLVSETGLGNTIAVNLSNVRSLAVASDITTYNISLFNEGVLLGNETASPGSVVTFNDLSVGSGYLISVEAYDIDDNLIFEGLAENVIVYADVSTPVTLTMIRSEGFITLDITFDYAVPSDYPEIQEDYILNYGAPNFIETVEYDDGTFVTRAIWDGANVAYERSVTTDDILTASFVDNSVTEEDYAQLGTEEEVIQPYLDAFGVMDSAIIYLYDGINLPDYYIDTNNNGVWDTGEVYVVETNFKGIDSINGTIDYNWNDEFVYVYLEHLITLVDGTKIYGIYTAIDMLGSAFTSISL